jgi:RND family efflux transporter MFP subunit
MNPMTKRSGTIIAIVIALAALGIGARALLLPRSVAPVPAALPAAQPAVTTLEFLPQEVVNAEPVELRQMLLLSGSLRAVDLASVKAKVGGDVREVLVREGEPVKAGQIVARMDAAEYEARVAQARGNLNSARAQLEMAAKTRDNNLAPVERGFISKNALDNSASQYNGAKASVDAAQGALDLVQKSLNDTVIRAPISGLVSVRLVQPGEKVAADNKLLEIVNLQKMELEAALPSADLARVAIGQPVTLRVEGLSESFEGRVARINPATQAGTRSVPVYIQVANPQSLLRVGMFAEAQLTLASKISVLALPQSAVRKDGNGLYVFVIADGKIERRPIVLGIAGMTGDEFRTEVTSGLDAGMKVVRTDMGNLRPGTPVRIAASAAQK